MILALALLAWNPEALGGFYYHPRALALVHLVTLGWITGNILGSLYLVGPVALRTAFPATRIDALAFASVSIGAVGMVSHFWIDEYSGMVWAAWTVLVGIGLVGWRVLAALARAPIPAVVKLHIALAFANILAAGLLGSLLGLEKRAMLTLPGVPLAGVYAHAHLAALGWATMMVMGIGYRLLPMQLPAAMPRGRVLWAGAALLEVGLVGLVPALMLGSAWALPFALMTLLALALFLSRVVWMLRNRRPAPAGQPRPDLAIAQTAQALAYLVVAAGIGLALLLLPASERTVRLVFVYGVLALLGFLGQIILGVGARLLPLVAWMQQFVRSDFVAPSRSHHDLIDRRALAGVLATWSVGVPALAWALYAGSTRGVRGAASLLLTAALLDAYNRFRSFRVSRQLAAADSASA